MLIQQLRTMEAVNKKYTKLKPYKHELNSDTCEFGDSDTTEVKRII